MKKLTKAHILNNMLILSEDGPETLPIPSNLPHRFEVVDGEIVDKYNGVSDIRVREIDHATEQAKIAAAQKEWDDAEEKVGPRPIDLPALDLPEEDEE